MLYRWMILLHVIGVVVFFSNAIGALFWQRRASRSRDPRLIAHAFSTLNAGDLWITPIATLMIVVTGIVVAVVAGLPLLGTGWIVWSIVAFSLAGLLFLAGALPVQIRLAGWTAASVGREGFDWPRYEREARRWAFWAHTSLGLALLALALMLLRPKLPGL
jgi:uncharacterized membrane protein